MMSHTTQSSRAAFSLVEMLVAVAITAILAALLYPALGRAIASSKMTKTQSNMRQIAQGIDLYVADNNGIYLSVGKGWDDQDPSKRRMPWVQVIWPYIYPNQKWPGWAPADLDGTVFHSPFIDNSNPGARSYGMNAILEDRHPRRRYRFLPNPTAVALLGDVKSSSEFRAPQVNPRNNGKVSVFFLGGNAEFLNPEDIPAKASDVFWSGNL